MEELTTENTENTEIMKTKKKPASSSWPDTLIIVVALALPAVVGTLLFHRSEQAAQPPPTITATNFIRQPTIITNYGAKIYLGQTNNWFRIAPPVKPKPKIGEVLI